MISLFKVRTRIELLQRVKALVEKTDHSGLSKDVCTLVNRELEMLTRGTELGNELLEGLRKRLSNQFAKLLSKLNSKWQDTRGTENRTKPKFQLHKPGTMKCKR